jgi:hypothetical protein
MNFPLASDEAPLFSVILFVFERGFYLKDVCIKVEVMWRRSFEVVGYRWETATSRIRGG